MATTKESKNRPKLDRILVAIDTVYDDANTRNISKALVQVAKEHYQEIIGRADAWDEQGL